MHKNQVFQLVLAVFFVSLLFPITSSAIVPFDLRSRTFSRDFSVDINSGDKRTYTRKVELRLRAPSDTKRMRISNTPDIGNARWQAFTRTKEWYLDFGRGDKKVYVQFERDNGDVTITFSDTIILVVAQKPFIDVSINDGDDTTFTRTVFVSTTVSEGVEHMQVNNSRDFDDIPWRVISDSFQWNLPIGEGKKTVYFRFRDAQGRTFTRSASISVLRLGQRLEEGDIVTSPGDSIYYYGFDGALHDYPSLAVFHTWFDDFDFKDIVHVSNAELSQYPVGESVTPRPGSWLVRFGSNTSEVYGVEPGYVLRPFFSEIEKELLYGADWEKRVVTINQAERAHYRVRPFTEDLPDDAVDRDDDGLTEEVEQRYGSSDRKKDTDGDGLSDYEEVQFFASDPRLVDTSGNGVSDGDMLLSGQLPAAGGPLRAFVQDSYTYSRGTVVDKPSGKGLYFFNSDGKIKSMSERIYRSDPTVNAFVVSPLYPIDIGRTGSMGKTDKQSYASPMIYRQGKLERL